MKVVEEIFVFAIGILVGMALIVASATSKPTIQIEDGLKWFEYVDDDVIRHRETGVCYYATEDYITPLYNADGSLYTLGD